MVYLCGAGVATSMKERMLYNTVEPLLNVDIGDNIIIPIPVVDKRSPFNPPNLTGVITGTSEDG